MMFGAQNATIRLLAFAVIGAIIAATNAKRPTRIVGGKDATIGEAKWMVSISPGHQPTLCGGAIIGPRHILTAAHCFHRVSPGELIVRGGVVDLNDTSATVNTVARLIPHPSYRPLIRGRQESQNDIGIVVLSQPLNLDDGRLTAIRLPTKQPETPRASFSGWGLLSRDPQKETTILQTAEVQVISDEECRAANINPNSPQFFCGYQENGNILDGDSGGPLTYDGEIIGVASTGWAVRKVPDSFTNVYHYVEWINWVMSHRY